MDRAESWKSRLTEQSADEYIAREEAWRKVNSGEELTPEEMELVGLTDDKWCPEAHEMDANERRVAAVAYQDCHLNPEQFPTRTDRWKRRQQHRPEWVLFGMKSLSGPRVLKRLHQEAISGFNEKFLKEPEAFRKFMMSPTVADYQIPLVDIDPDLPVLLIAGGNFEDGLSLELFSAQDMEDMGRPVVVSSRALHKTHEPKMDKPEYKRGGVSMVPPIIGLSFKLELPARTIELGRSLLHSLKFDKKRFDAGLADAEEDPWPERGVVIGSFFRSWKTVLL